MQLYGCDDSKLLKFQYLNVDDMRTNLKLHDKNLLI